MYRTDISRSTIERELEDKKRGKYLRCSKTLDPRVYISEQISSGGENSRSGKGSNRTLSF